MSKKHQGFEKGNAMTMTHGAHLWQRRGVLPPDKEYLREFLDITKVGLIRDLGGDITTSQEILVDSIISNLGFCWLVEAWVLQEGVFVDVKDKNDKTIDKRMRAPLNGFWGASQNNIRRTLETLGLNKGRLEGEIDLKKYLEAKDAKD